MKKLLIIIVLAKALNFGQDAYAQSVGISDVLFTPDASSMLEVRATNKGVLIPRVALTSTSDVVTIASPEVSLLVYNQASVNDVTPGFYFWSGTAWIRLLSGAMPTAAWTLTGNAASAYDFIGTTNAEDFRTFTNNLERMRVTFAGDVGIGTTAPTNRFHVDGSVRFQNLPTGTTETNALLIDAGGVVRTRTLNPVAFTGAITAETDPTAWRLTGNAVTVDGTHFIGTTDNIPFNIRVNNQRSGRIDHLLFNTFFGFQAGNANTTGHRNTSIGADAFGNNTTGSWNTAIGRSALFNNTTGNYNTAIGRSALFNNTTGDTNTVIGPYVLYANTIGNRNIAIGWGALHSNVAGSNATAIGTNAMQFANNTATPFINTNVAVGFEALRGSTTASANTGNDNTAIGYQTLMNNTTGIWNTATGFQALVNNTTGNHNTATGLHALVLNTTGSSNTATGVGALRENTTGSLNTAIGKETLHFNNTGDRNIAIGRYALHSNVAGSNATAIGTNAMQFANNQASPFTNTNVAVGFEALRGGTTPSLNIGNNNTALGYQTLMNNTTGNWNTATGYHTLPLNTIGNYNTATGVHALSFNTTGGWNTATGVQALRDNTIGNRNTATGVQSLPNNSTGNFNVALGHQAGYGASGINFNQCTFIGAQSYPTVARTNVTMLGFGIGNAQCTGDNQVLLGNTAITQIRSQQTGITGYSDARMKTNVKEDVSGLNFIMKLKPVTYNQDPTILHKIWKTPDSLLSQIDHSEIKTKRFIGFLAQDVEKAARESGFNFPGIDVPRNEKEVYSMRYVDFIMPMVKAMQEQQKMIEDFQITNDELKTENSSMQLTIEELQIMIEKLIITNDELKTENIELQTQISNIICQLTKLNSVLGTKAKK